MLKGATMGATPACDHLREDHRRMEDYLDRLFKALSDIRPEIVPEIRETMANLQRLEALHFEKEEGLFYPNLRSAFPDLLAQMDLQHQDIREVEQHVAEMLSNAPELPEVRWLDEVRRSGTELYDRIQHHIFEEEEQLFRVAGTHLSPDEQESLAIAFARIQNRRA
jgi:hemerythrin-like domain-containing protein